MTEQYQYRIGRVEVRPIQEILQKFIVSAENVGGIETLVLDSLPVEDYGTHGDIAKACSHYDPNTKTYRVLGGGWLRSKKNCLRFSDKSRGFGAVPYEILEKFATMTLQAVQKYNPDLDEVKILPKRYSENLVDFQRFSKYIRAIQEKPGEDLKSK